MKQPFLVNAITYFFILLFLYTGAEKFMEISAFKDQLVASPLLGSMAGFVAWALPITEVMLAIALFIPRWQLKALYASGILMILFTIYVAAILLIDTHISCSCGGIIENLSPRQHLLFNGATIALAGIAILSARRPQSSLRFRWFSSSGAILMLASIGWIIFVAFRAPTKVKTGLEGRLLPSFHLLLSDSLTWLDTKDIPTGKPFIMVGFSPYCIHCQAEMRDIVKNIARFGDTTIYFVTAFPYSDMKKFYDVFHLKKYPNIIAASDSSNAFMRFFKANSIPYIAIYDAKKRLKEVVQGEVKAEMLSKSLDD
jgi:thiol-disulfide isomerase/thioredoxin